MRNKSIIIIPLLLMLVFSCNKLIAQKELQDSIKEIRPGSLEFLYQKGYVFPTNDFVKGHNAENDIIDEFQAFSVRITKQTIGKKLWEQQYNYPEYGLGIYVADFYNPQEIGVPIALYGYYTAPFYRWEKFLINYELGFGIAFNWKNYSQSNTFNTAIGAKYTVYLDLGIKAEYRFHKNFSVSAGFSLTHFSNGHLKDPNFGLNTIAPKIGIKYHLHKELPQFISREIPKYRSKNEFSFSVFGGMKNIIYDSMNIPESERFEGLSFFVGGFMGTVNRQISYKSKIGLGLSLSYDGSINAQVAVDEGELEVSKIQLLDHFQMSIFASYEWVVNKVSVLLQPGIYIYRKQIKNKSPVFYQRIGLKYNFYNNYYAGISLRAYYFSVSDFIEWSVGYSF